jgi:hypothetical protein
MPVKDYNPLFGGNAQKALDSMVSQYGEEKGRQVFYATVRDRQSGKSKTGLKAAVAKSKDKPKSKGKSGPGRDPRFVPFVKGGKGAAARSAK